MSLSEQRAAAAPTPGLAPGTVLGTAKMSITIDGDKLEQALK